MEAPYHYFKNAKECLDFLQEKVFYPPHEIWCNATWDTFVCWPATPANMSVHLPCPPLRGLDASKYAFRKCKGNGYWMGKDQNDMNGWSNYTNCYTQTSLELYKKIFKGTSSQNQTMKQQFISAMKDVANRARVMELVGLCLSLICLLISLFIFSYFRSLKCDRTKIHCNLFAAIIIHIMIQLIVHIDKMVALYGGTDVGGSTSVSAGGTIYSTVILCECFEAIKEYTKSVMFVWMFIEGWYLHNILVSSVFTQSPNFCVFYILGWGSPLILVIIWAIYSHFKDEDQCWFGYTFKSQYWIIEIPRVLIIAINLLFLLNIVRVLVTKLRQTHTNEAEQVRKAVKAAIVLLPLLGVTNFLVMVESPVNSLTHFAAWTFISNFFISFQGCFISLLYCFLNTEVQQRVKRSWRNWQCTSRCVRGRTEVQYQSVRGIRGSNSQSVVLHNETNM